MNRVGKYTIEFQNTPAIAGFGSVAGKKESEGPLKDYFHKIEYDTKLGCDTWEQAESRLQTEAIKTALEKSQINGEDIQIAFGGDLLNQCISTSYCIRDFNIPFLGQYGACSTMVQSLMMAGIMVDGGYAKNALAVTSSHFCSAERQYRFPLEYGGQRTPTAQWTVTGSGAIVVSETGNGPKLKHCTVGKVTDMGVTDINNMGAAMAPAACETIKAYLKDTKTKPSDYDLILTGDLGKIGSELLNQLLQQEHINIVNTHNDCGMMIFDIEKQDVHAGGSGCGCCGSVLCSIILEKMCQRALKNILVIATGALMSPTSNQQGESTPGIAHLVHLEI
ncbi:MAG: stage V sporulation protein AD [Acutalibacteraceae bacterium]|nr:stage V sporulation protein AD [Acutalibacteraceae bacterium]